MIGKSNAGAMKGEEPKLTMLAPRWSLDDVAGHSVDWWLTTEDLPKPDNRVTVDGDGHIHLAYTSTNDKEAEGLYDELKNILNHVGMAQHHVLDKNFYMAMNVPIAGVAHQAGTCRFGTDPATSVLDVNCKAHELDNLYVVDTSFFPSIGAVNPALTAMANAMRVGEHLIERSGEHQREPLRHRVVIVGGGLRRPAGHPLPGPQRLGRGHAGRPAQPPPVPAPPLPGGHRSAPAGPDRPGSASRRPQAQERPGRAGRGHRVRPGPPGRARQRPRRRDAWRSPTTA